MTQIAEYHLSDREFERLRSLVRSHTAIELSDQKRQLVHSRFSRRLRALGLASFDQYCDLIEDGHAGEIDEFASAITTNFTRFFREKHHFEFLRERVAAASEQKRLRIWSAGCSTGEEPCSIAITLLDAIADIDHWDIRILATDLDGAALKIAREGIYPEDRIAGVDPQVLKRWFRRGRGRFAKQVRVAQSVLQLISYRELNLIDGWPMQKAFDIIFCRNVVIYFGQDTKTKLISGFANMQHSGGHLIMGHSENLSRLSDRYRPLGNTIYRLD